MFTKFSEYRITESLETVVGKDLDIMMNEIYNANIKLNSSILPGEMKESLKLTLKKVDYFEVQRSFEQANLMLDNLKDFLGEKPMYSLKDDLDKALRKTLLTLEDEYQVAKLINSDMLTTIVNYLNSKGIKFKFEIKDTRYFSFIFNVRLKVETAESLNNLIIGYYDRYPTSIFRKYTWTLFSETSGFKNIETGLNKKEYNI